MIKTIYYNRSLIYNFCSKKAITASKESDLK